ncbi:hypothetical protein K439DRAFT_206120 [Ramaria rubella]|nr:hypothetical protein K439DRAFT_206120 [Ramaria rubella]
MSESMAILQAIMSVASSIVLTTDSQRHSATTPAPYTATLIDIPQFMSPDSLYPRLNDLGLPNDVSIRMSAAYMRRAEILQSSVEEALRTAYTKLVAHPWDPDAMPLDLLRQKIFVQQHHVYQTTLSKWQDDIIHLARSRLDRLQAASSQSSAKVPSTVFTKKSKRRFKSEYLPLFEFAFEKDRFPSREDKKHLARISGMSYRQVCVWVSEGFGFY